MHFNLIGAVLLPRKKTFDIMFRFQLRHNADLKVQAIELIVHHEQYGRTITLPYLGERQYDTFVQYGTGVDFNEIEAALILDDESRTEPIFYYVGQPEIELRRRFASSSEDVA